MKKFSVKSVATITLVSLVLGLLPPVPVSADNSLYADISASPSSGLPPLNNVSLTAVVSGTAQGNITYRFDCTSDGVWDLTQVSGSPTYTASNLCNYATAGNYTATIKIERENLSFQGTIAILVQAPAAPTVDIKANGSDGPITIAYNTAANLSWTSANATSCTASVDWSGAKATSGSESTANLTAAKTYTITCTGAGGSASDSVTVNVQAAPAPTVDIKANNSDGPITIAYNTAATLSWTSANATSCTASSSWSGSKSTSGSESTGNLTASSNTYTITCTGAGGSATDSVIVLVQSPAPTVDIKANSSDGPITIAYNSSATLSWTSTNTTACTASSSPAAWSGAKATSGSESTGNLINSITYTITCTGAGGSATDSVIVLVQSPAPTVDIKANGSDGPITITYNTAATLSWTSTNATTCSASNSWSGSKAVSGSESTGNLTASVSIYTITCTGAGGSASDSVTVNTQASAPTVDIKANGSDGPITIAYNTAATLSWTSTNATICSASGDWSGSKAVSGSESTGNLTTIKTYVYSITCNGAGGSASDSVSVTVAAQPALYVTLEASPNVGITSLNGVNLRATVAGTVTGIISYKFDCTSDGVWDYATSTNDVQFQTGPLCNYPNIGSYQARVQVQRGTLTVQGNSVVQVVAQSNSQAPTLFVNLQAQPNNGNAPLNSNLTATVSGTVNGNTTFKFDCTSDGAWENTVTSSSVSASFSCTYSPSGTYVAKVQADRGGLTVWGNSTIVVQ